LFYGHLMKMTTNSSKVAHKADLGLFSTLRNFLSPRVGCSLRDRFWELYIFQSRPI
jgi:hypothetical protein